MDPSPVVTASAADLAHLVASRRPPLAEVTETLGQGRYRVSFGGGTLEVKGPDGLRNGNRVRVTVIKDPDPETSQRGSNEGEPVEGGRLAVLLPLAFGGQRSQLKVTAFIARKDPGKGGVRPLYFLVETSTAALGLTQWGIHLAARRLAVQVYAPLRPKGGGPWDELVKGVESRLVASGFELAHPVQFLTRPLRAPAGYGVSVRG